MRYLFGDSTPFPLPFDFLLTLEAFMTRATSVILLDHKTVKLGEDTVLARVERAQGLEVLTKFHESLLRSLGESAVPQHPYAIEYAQRMAERAVGLVSERRGGVEDADNRGQAKVAAAKAKAAEETARLLSEFFEVAELPTLSTSLSLRLVDGKPEVRAARLYPGGISAAFLLGSNKMGVWAAPRKLLELAGHLELMVGIKKSWIGSKVSREPARLDDCILSGADLDEDKATFHVRKKVDQKDHLVFTLMRSGPIVSGEVENPGDPNAGQVPPELDQNDLPHLERLWGAVRTSLDELVPDRKVVSLKLDGKEVFQEGLARALIERLVGLFAPTALEVKKKSPNAEELSLKREGEGGRREELYLKRTQLVGSLQALPREGRAIFAPLGLDDWVPAATARPPQVTVDDVDSLTSIDLEEEAVEEAVEIEPSPAPSGT